MEHALPFAAASAATARHLLSADLRRAGIASDVRDDACLVVSELVGNAVRHGQALHDPGLVGDALRVAWSWTAATAGAPGVLRVAVQDGGPGPSRRGPRDCSAGSLDSDEDGRGLTIVGLLASGWGVEDRSLGAVVWAELALPVPPQRGRGAGSRTGTAGRSRGAGRDRPA